MKVLMFYHNTLFINSLMTLMHTHYYASVHVLPEETSASTPFYTHYKQMGTHH